MSNWYKIAFRGNIPRNEDSDEKIRNPYITNRQMTPFSEDVSPSSFGDKERDGYPKGISQYEGTEDKKINNDFPSQPNLMDSPPQTQMNDSQMDYYTDDIDKLKDFNYKEPVGALNMPHHNNMEIFKKTKEKSRLKGLNMI